jgi:hypothetical protein
VETIPRGGRAVHVCATAPDKQLAAASLIVTDVDHHYDVALILRGLSRIYGYVTAPPGQDLSELWVIAAPSRGVKMVEGQPEMFQRGRGRKAVRVDSDGRYEIGGVPDGGWAVIVGSGPASSTSYGEIIFVKGADVRHDLQLVTTFWGGVRIVSESGAPEDVHFATTYFEMRQPPTWLPRPTPAHIRASTPPNGRSFAMGWRGPSGSMPESTIEARVLILGKSIGTVAVQMLPFPDADAEVDWSKATELRVESHQIPKVREVELAIKGPKWVSDVEAWTLRFECEDNGYWSHITATGGSRMTLPALDCVVTPVYADGAPVRLHATPSFAEDETVTVELPQHLALVSFELEDPLGKDIPPWSFWLSWRRTAPEYPDPRVPRQDKSRLGRSGRIALLPGRYDFTVTREGFKKATRESVDVMAGERMTVEMVAQWITQR